MILSTIPLSLLFLFAAIPYIAQWVYLRFFSRHSLPSNIPWAGVNDRGVLSRARATLRSVLDTRGLLDEAYTKVRHTGPGLGLTTNLVTVLQKWDCLRLTKPPHGARGRSSTANDGLVITAT
jgi:hypothetical protein